MSRDEREPDGARREPWLSVTVQPEPEPEERDALIAALTASLAARPAVEDAERLAPPSRWREEGRTAAMRGIANSPPVGWGRRRPGWLAARYAREGGLG